MTKEEFFRKNYPDSCYGDKPLSPYWDFFQDGVEFGERESEKKIADLEKENAELKGLVNQYKASKCSGISMVNRNMIMSDQLTKAKELLERFLGLGNLWDLDCKDYFPLRKEVEQFLNSEVEK